MRGSLLEVDRSGAVGQRLTAVPGRFIPIFSTVGVAFSEARNSMRRLDASGFLAPFTTAAAAGGQNLPRLVSLDLAEQIHQVADLDIFQRTYSTLDFLTQFLVSVIPRQFVELRLDLFPSEWSVRGTRII